MGFLWILSRRWELGPSKSRVEGAWLGVAGAKQWPRQCHCLALLSPNRYAELLPTLSGYPSEGTWGGVPPQMTFCVLNPFIYLISLCLLAFSLLCIYFLLILARCALSLSLLTLFFSCSHISTLFQIGRAVLNLTFLLFWSVLSHAPCELPTESPPPKGSLRS